MTAVSLEGVAKRFGPVLAVDGISLAIAKGEFVTLLGPSGCGKTTTLRLIAGFLRPSEGRIAMNGRHIESLPPHRREIGLVFQSFALFPHMTVADNVAFGLRMRGVAGEERRRRVGDALDLVRLVGLAESYPRQLSGGQQQRVALARALVIRPQLLLLDEPFGALDPQLREHLQQELKTLQKKLKLTTLFVTHDQAEAMLLSDRIAIMNRGKLEQIGWPRDIYEQPRSRFVAEFMGRSNLLHGKVTAIENGFAQVEAGTLTLEIPLEKARTGESVTLLIRPERVRLRRGPAVEGIGRCGGVVDSVFYLGSSLTYKVALADGTLLQATQSNTGEEGASGIEQGMAVQVEILQQACFSLKGDEAG